MDGALSRRFARTLIVLVAIAVSLLSAELVTRAIDGYDVWSIYLRRMRDVPARTTPDRQYSASNLAAGVNPSWYESTPPDPPRVPTDPAIAARAAAPPIDPLWPYFWWNAAFIRQQVCGHLAGPPGALEDFYVFEPVDGRPFPRYRHLPHVTPPGWFTPNAFGWRGAEISAQRPTGTIRIAFVGSSTTVGNYSWPFSYPEVIGHWLNLWSESQGRSLRFEVINAARPGIEAKSIEAVVRTEVLSVDPDLIVYYEGANNFSPSWTLSMPAGTPPRPTATFRQRSRTENYSAIAGRLFDAILKSGHDGGEPPKPHFKFVWPKDVSESDPDVTRPDTLPIAMDAVVGSLDAIRRSSATTGAELAISSFVWLADDGMQLDLSRHLTLFRYLNETYWPLTYAHIHRMAAFENAVFRNYARTYSLVYVPMAESYPHDPDLFSDAIHFTERGMRLQAWILLQHLIPIIDAHIRSNAWPKAPSASVPPSGWTKEPQRLMTRSAMQASCPTTVH
ncbi:MAG TPA: hypothetical protein VFP91_14560 [Vicinamibacterales bacterium]|nr:hypothetical protein [Vicinamibacterales bacterium]